MKRTRRDESPHRYKRARTPPPPTLSHSQTHVNAYDKYVQQYANEFPMQYYGYDSNNAYKYPQNQMSYLYDNSQYAAMYAHQMHQPPLPTFNPSQPPPPPPPPQTPSLQKSDSSHSTYPSSSSNSNWSNNRHNKHNQNGNKNYNNHRNNSYGKNNKPNNSPGTSNNSYSNNINSTVIITPLNQTSESNINEEVRVNKRGKRKSMSTRYSRKKEWDYGDALKATELEKEYNKKQKVQMLLIRFPDPDLNKEVVRSFSPCIENVHFQQPSTPRHCFVSLKPGSDINKIESVLSEIPFGCGKLIVKRHTIEEKISASPEEIDPYTLYIGNLPTNITVHSVKEKFPTAQRIDIGYAQRLRYTRYAFIRYNNIEDSMEAFRKTFSLEIDSRTLIVRFRRQKGNVGLPGESLADRQNRPRKEIPEKSSNDTIGIPVNNADTPQPTIDTPINNIEQTPEKSNDNNVVWSQSKPPKKKPEPKQTQKSNNDEGEKEKQNDSVKETIVPIDKIKLEKLEDDPIIDKTINLLGTDIKAEPSELDDTIEDDEIIEEDESEEGLSDIEEDDDEDDIDYRDEDEEDDEDANVYKDFHLENIRQQELLVREQKPDVEELQELISKDEMKENQNIKTNSTNEKENENDDLYESLNPDDENSFF